jgi:hypothetical protein
MFLIQWQKLYKNYLKCRIILLQKVVMVKNNVFIIYVIFSLGHM